MQYFRTRTGFMCFEKQCKLNRKQVELGVKKTCEDLNYMDTHKILQVMYKTSIKRLKSSVMKEYVKAKQLYGHQTNTHHHKQKTNPKTVEDCGGTLIQKLCTV